MKLSHEDKLVEQGRAVARGMDEIHAQKERNMAKAAKRTQTMLARAAEKALSGN